MLRGGFVRVSRAAPLQWERAGGIRERAMPCVGVLAARGAHTDSKAEAERDQKFAGAESNVRARLAHGGMPDFIEAWNPALFRKVGYGMVVATAASFPLAWHHDVGALMPLIATATTSGYWTIGLRDLATKTQSLRQNFPVLIHVRYVLESIRGEIQQYFIESDEQAVPFSRAARSVIYQRAKGAPDTRSLGTRRQVYGEGFEWANHSMFPVPAEEVENRVTIGGPKCLQPYSAALLNISAMSYGALSGPAVEALSRGACKGGFYHNTGEGGISRYHLSGGADIVWNVGTGYFACGKDVDGRRVFDPEQFAENAQRPNIKMIELKLSQGAKPAHGGILPASKITPQIAEARGLGAAPWADCVSPPSHSAFQSPKELMFFLDRLRELSGGKPVGIKLCVGHPHEVAALVHAMLETGLTPDFITVDGCEGGTGAAPPEFQDSVGMPLAEGLRLVDSFLIGAGLRGDVKLIAAGKVYNGFSLVRTLALGADVTNAARSMMFALGCIQALKCNSNKCPTGITTQDPALASALDVESKSWRVAKFQNATVHAACEIIGAIGVRRTADVGPEHIMRRESGINVKTLADLHEDYFAALPAGSLLDPKSVATIPPKMRQWWLKGGDLYRQTA